MTGTFQTLPTYLKKYCVEQPENKYTARDHAAWRYIMRQSRNFFKEHAVDIYFEGLKATGVTFDRIPTIEEMDGKLMKFGWGAVPVCGFIPPAAFLDFQARKILPIASDMRSVDHIHYTPAPDIVHEAAGHAPIIADPEYSDYLTRYAGMAQKAIFSVDDFALYEAIRTLSDIKENPDSSPEQIIQAEAELKEAAENVSFVSEANKTARMNWWTVEYGLLGPIDRPKIYGAGLLSSVGESKLCLTPKVKKLPLTVDCTSVSYDITEQQPQLFVAKSITHLRDVLSKFEETLSYVRGGQYGLEQAKLSGTLTTVTLDSGLMISGVLKEYAIKNDFIEWLEWDGPIQLSDDTGQIFEESYDAFSNGYGCPFGALEKLSEKEPFHMTEDDWRYCGLRFGEVSTLNFNSGASVKGIPRLRHERNQNTLIIIFDDAEVTKKGQLIFSGPKYFLSLGMKTQSVFGGPGDRESYASIEAGVAKTTPGRLSPLSAAEIDLNRMYGQIRAARDDMIVDAPKALGILGEVKERLLAHPREWIIRVEMLEICDHLKKAGEIGVQKLEGHLIQELKLLKTCVDSDVASLIEQGLEIVHISDRMEKSDNDYQNF